MNNTPEIVENAGTLSANHIPRPDRLLDGKQVALSPQGLVFALLLVILNGCMTVEAPGTQPRPAAVKPAAEPAQLARSDSIEKLLKGLRAEDPEQRASSAYHISKLPHGEPRAIPELLKILPDSRRVDIQRYIGAGYVSSYITTPGDEAAFALGKTGKNAVVDLLLTLRSENPQVRSRAARALGISRDPRGIQYLIQRLGDADPGVRAAASAALLHFPEDEIVPNLIQVLENEQGNQRSMAVYLLGKLKNAAAYDALVTLTEHQTPELRAAAALSLGQLHDKRAINILRDLLKDPIPYVRSNSAYALGNYTSRKTILALIDALGDQDESVNSAALESLHRITGQELGNDPTAWKSWLNTAEQKTLPATASESPL